jgi:aryl-alcohol dehydrogenase-like predicted oxidoreductase
VRYVGASNHSAAQVIELLWAAERLGLEPIVCLQNQYNLLHRWPVEPELLGVCRRYGLGLMTYSPLAVGLLSGRFRRGVTPPPDTYWDQERLREALDERADWVIEVLVDLAEQRGATPAQLALASFHWPAESFHWPAASFHQAAALFPQAAASFHWPAASFHQAAE